MITRIQKKEFDSVQEARGRMEKPKGTGLYFKAENGLYYKSDLEGMMAVKEMTEHNRAIKQQMADQVTLL